MSLLSSAELSRIERAHAAGIGSSVIVESFRKRRERFSEATLRKYVQLGLLPKSRRVGQRGRHRGSSGLYPVGIVRLINEIKRALERGATLEEIRLGSVGLLGEVQGLRRAFEQAMSRFAQAVELEAQRTRKGQLRRTLGQHRRAVESEMRAFERLVEKVGRLPQRT
ncbi:MAG: MerR family transcriptional regulator [Deltaproteobacteria bacterium]|nr:MerR family transcriptional regulator [Deltaproteobacteria bacterium]